ncbi:hypothetical protein K490DRAFT_59036 [Saccharata proteae CBS 121410]|uniref:GPI anchored protein n=1 Tax=Saccharata proteae CBS 121410 TaxID=1314787 RepID=A0A9P4LUS3_9PEZI|nr:hypothetical protein K490DRAFT_59036 [Saccharata proteae CBS 121410]
MQYTAITLLGLAALAVAEQQKPKANAVERRATSLDQASVVNVLLTALPPSLLSVAITNAAAASSEIESEFAAGMTESWFEALPTDIQSYLLGEGSAGATIATAAPTPAPNASAVASNSSSLASAASSIISSVKSVASASANATSTATGATASSSSAGTGSAASSMRSTTTGGSSESASSASGASASGTSTGGASLPTGVIGAGVIGALGFVGMLAL